ncbi:MAG: hypothetical protein WAV07_07565 [Candidatus Contendobacter sp.]
MRVRCLSIDVLRRVTGTGLDRWGDFPETERASREVLSLLMHPLLAERELERVVAVLKGQPFTPPLTSLNLTGQDGDREPC